MSFSSLNYLVVLPPLIMQDSWFLSKVFTHLINLLPKPYIYNGKNRIKLSTEWSAFEYLLLLISCLISMCLLSPISQK